MNKLIPDVMSHGVWKPPRRKVAGVIQRTLRNYSTDMSDLMLKIVNEFDLIIEKYCQE